MNVSIWPYLVVLRLLIKKTADSSWFQGISTSVSKTNARQTSSTGSFKKILINLFIECDTGKTYQMNIPGKQFLHLYEEIYQQKLKKSFCFSLSLHRIFYSWIKFTWSSQGVGDEEYLNFKSQGQVTLSQTLTVVCWMIFQICLWFSVTFSRYRVSEIKLTLALILNNY